MFSKKHRLAKTKDVKNALFRGRNFFNPFYAVKRLQKTEGARFTIIVSTKVYKKAVKRNRIKRILREFIRIRLGKFQPGDYAVIVKPRAANVDEKVLLVSFEKLLSDSRLLNKLF